MFDNNTATDGAPLRLQQLSALMDGELDRTAVERACSRWRDDPELRDGWQVYHLIGDVLRSDELACNAARSARLMDSVRRRLVDEPVPLALMRSDDTAVGVATGTANRGGHRPRWLLPVGVAAAFVAASTLVMTRAVQAPTGETVSTLARGPVATPPQTLVAVAQKPSGIAADPPPPWVLADGQLVRDVRLDRYLNAHKQFGGSSALGVPSGFLRSATLQVPER